MLGELLSQLKVETYNFLSHSVEDREQILCGSRLKDFSREELRRKGVKDFVPFITCGRVEFIYLADDFLGFDGFEKLQGFDAFEHLVSVVSGLKSLVIGETQVVNQFKKAFFDAISSGLATTKILSVFSEVMRIAKKVRTEVALPNLSFANFVRSKSIELLGNTDDKVLFVIGTGQIAHDIYRISKYFRKTLIFSHHRERAKQKVEKIREFFNADAEYVCSVSDGLQEADVVVIATEHKGFIIRKEHTKDINRRILIFDLSFPRNVDPEIVDGKKVILFDIDSFGKITVSPEILEFARKMINQEINSLKMRVEMEKNIKELATIKEDFEKIIYEHVRKYLKLSDEEEIKEFSKSLSKKLLSRFFEESRRHKKEV